MKKERALQKTAAELRREAEARLGQFPGRGGTGRTDAELLHELQVHQIELEMQNETLRQSQIALEESRDRYVDFYDFAPVGYLTLNEQGLITELNLAGAEILGAARSKLVRSRFSPSVAPEHRDRWHQHFTNTLHNQSKLRCELELVRPDGARVDVLVSSVRLTREEHAPVLRVALTDISERKQADDALKASQQRFLDIVNTTEGIVWEADATSFDFSFVSRQAERLLGHPIEDWLKPGFWVEHLHPDDKAWVPEYCASFTRQMVPHDFEYRLIAEDGRVVWLHDIVTVVAENGAPRWLRGIMVDISRNKKVEGQLREMAASLEATVEERTLRLRRLAAQLTVTEERERRMLAQDLHDNLGQLLAVIKIKLTSLAGNELQPEIDKVMALVDQAEQSARSITLELSPPILHRLGLMPALEWLGDEIERVYGISVEVDGSACESGLGPELEAVLYRATRELLINVAKHAKVHRARVSVMCDEGELILCVSDDGCGFDRNAHGGPLSGQRSFGLSSIYERIVNLGGAMEVDSSPGNGTTINLRVPCRNDLKGVS
ncbi:MAG: PAS domain S-box protein [Sulfuritalea sp.]|nr:PAS domain S-box protein [Sulfuritalea sp.]